MPQQVGIEVLDTKVNDFKQFCLLLQGFLRNLHLFDTEYRHKLLERLSSCFEAATTEEDTIVQLIILRNLSMQLKTHPSLKDLMLRFSVKFGLSLVVYQNQDNEVHDYQLLFLLQVLDSHHQKELLLPGSAQRRYIGFGASFKLKLSSKTRSGN